MAEQGPVLNQIGTHVWLVNSETDGVWECPIDYAGIALERGWEYAADPAVTAAVDVPAELLALVAETAAPVVETQTGFDPSEHTVAAVNAYLAEHAEAAPGEVERVLLLEANGENRKTVKPPADPTDPAVNPDDESPTPGDLPPSDNA